MKGGGIVNYIVYVLKITKLVLEIVGKFMKRKKSNSAPVLAEH